jgi:hypothetical protein
MSGNQQGINQPYYNFTVFNAQTTNDQGTFVTLAYLQANYYDMTTINALLANDIHQGGNSFGANITIGATDGFGLIFEQSNYKIQLPTTTPTSGQVLSAGALSAGIYPLLWSTVAGTVTDILSGNSNITVSPGTTGASTYTVTLASILAGISSVKNTGGTLTIGTTDASQTNILQNNSTIFTFGNSSGLENISYINLSVNNGNSLVLYNIGGTKEVGISAPTITSNSYQLFLPQTTPSVAGTYLLSTTSTSAPYQLAFTNASSLISITSGNGNIIASPSPITGTGSLTLASALTGISSITNSGGSLTVSTTGAGNNLILSAGAFNQITVNSLGKVALGSTIPLVWTGSGGATVSITASNTGSATQNLIWPPAVSGASGSILQDTDGVGTLGWTKTPSFTSVSYQNSSNSVNLSASAGLSASYNVIFPVNAPILTTSFLTISATGQLSFATNPAIPSGDVVSGKWTSTSSATPPAGFVSFQSPNLIFNHTDANGVTWDTFITTIAYPTGTKFYYYNPNVTTETGQLLTTTGAITYSAPFITIPVGTMPSAIGSSNPEFFSFPIGGGGGTPGGGATQIQYNNTGVFGGITGSSTNGSNIVLTDLTLASDAITNVTNPLVISSTPGLSLASLTGILTIGSTNTTGNITVGNSSFTGTLSLGDASTTSTINIGTSLTTGSIACGDTAMSGNQNFNVGSGNIIFKATNTGTTKLTILDADPSSFTSLCTFDTTEMIQSGVGNIPSICQFQQDSYNGSGNQLVISGHTDTTKQLLFGVATHSASGVPAINPYAGIQSIWQNVTTIPFVLNESGSPVIIGGAPSLTATRGTTLSPGNESLEVAGNAAILSGASLRLYNTATTGYVSHGAIGANSSTDLNYTWPNSVSLSGNVLTSTTGGALSFVTPSTLASSSNSLVNNGNSFGALFKTGSNDSESVELICDGTQFLYSYWANQNVNISRTLSTSASAISRLQIADGFTATSWGLSGCQLSCASASFSDSSASGTRANTAINSIAQSTIASISSGGVYTNATSLYIAGAPIAGTNTTITNGYGLWDAGPSRFDGPLTLNTVPYTFPSSQGATGTTLSNNGSGGLSWVSNGFAYSSASVSGVLVTLTSNTNLIFGISSNSGGGSIELPVGYKGQVIVINDECDSCFTNNVTVLGQGGSTIQGQSDINFNIAGGNLSIYYNGTNWFIFSGFIPSQPLASATAGSSSVIGTGGTFTVGSNSTDRGGQITITTAGSAPSSSGTCGTVNLNLGGYSANPVILISAGNANAGVAMSTVWPYTVAGLTSFSFEVFGILSASSTYVFNYALVGTPQQF